ncbi:MAG TPA: MauE/DoxX family redox-associated membrane protein, partial [Solirubrobacteraceae bacterium]|nr:MauE/DoxX family redox-associated membrane protein [Solirubrobacteraceae bacterium]
GTRTAVGEFGVPEPVRGSVARLLPIAELAVAGALLVPGVARWGALGAVALLALFTAAMTRSMVRGEAPDCHCFGALASEPVGWRTLVRNVLLAAVAIFVVAGGWSSPGPSAVAWLGNLSPAGTIATAGGGALALTAAVAAVCMLGLLRQNGRLLLRVDELERRLDLAGVDVPAAPEPPAAGLAIGSPAPPFTLPGLYGEQITLESILALDRPALLLFTDPACGPCNALMPKLGEWRLQHGNALSLAVISRGTADQSRAKAREHGLGSVLLDADLATYNAYEIPATPAAVLIDGEGRIASPAAAGAQAIEAVVAQAVGNPIVVVPSQPAPPPGPMIGSKAPAVDLPDLTGKLVTASVPDRDTLVLFWNPGCGFCQQMLDDLRSWEADAPPDAPRLVLVSRGSADDNTAHGLRAPIVLDQSFKTGSVFGVGGTPSGLLVDRQGKIASTLAVGAPAVMALAAGSGVESS